jgi:hypothetical protein
VLVLWRLWETFCSASMVAALGLAMLSQFKFTVSIQCNETVEQQPLPSRGNAALGRPHSLRVLSSEAVSNPFPTGTKLPPPGTVLDEFRILHGQSFEPVDCRSDVVGG